MNNVISNYDIIFIGIIVVSGGFALIRGAISEVLSLSVWFITFLSMRHVSYLINNRLNHIILNSALRNIITFIIIFLITAIIITLIKKVCVSVISNIGLGPLNYLLGGLFGIIRGVLICSLLIIAIEMLHFDPTHNWKSSRLSVLLIPSVNWIIHQISTTKSLYQASNIKNQLIDI